jgi:hypothetical protein
MVDGSRRRLEFRPGVLMDPTHTSQSNSRLATLPSGTVLKGMEAEAEIRILARFEKHDEFVALQSEVLSLDDGTQASDEESRRQTKLMWNIFNIVRLVAARLLFSSRIEFSSQNTRNSHIYLTRS